MIDIFDIIDNQKVVHINIEGEVSSDGLFFDIEYINELTSLLLDNQKDVDFKIFDVKEYKDSEVLAKECREKAEETRLNKIRLEEETKKRNIP